MIRLFYECNAEEIWIKHRDVLSKTLNIRSIDILRFNKIDIFANFNFGVNDVHWLQIVMKTSCKFNTFFLLFY